MPTATPIEEPIALRYRFNFADKRDSKVELIDYSGELLNPEEQDSTLAESLRRKMEELDAIFVLAPYPSTEDSSVLPEQLNGLGSAFALLHEDKNKPPRIPIALVVNKWDRRASLADDDYDAEISALEEFIENDGKKHGHLALRNQLANLAADADFAIFPLSAFGESDRKEIGSDGKAKKDFPKLANVKDDSSGQLASFGMEDPFAWAIDRRDEIDREASEERAEAALRLNALNPIRLINI